jgi:predicted component of type VI protein secretion system
MAYLIFADRKGELARHELGGPITIGRSPDCTVVVRDVLLSRRHCQIEPLLDRWVVSDLGSKNGTFVDEQRIDRKTLDDGDVIRIGRTNVCYRAGAFVPAAASNRPADFRPIDPLEALASTVAGFRVEPEPKVDTKHFPRPQPRPPETKSLTSAEAAALVTGLSSSQWDDLIARGERPNRPLPKVSVNEDPTRKPRDAAARRKRGALIAAAAFAAIAVVVAVSTILR